METYRLNILIDRLSSLSGRALVWSHFCLCYAGQKLIHDVASIKKYGIKDGDQVWSGFCSMFYRFFLFFMQMVTSQKIGFLVKLTLPCLLSD